MIHIYYPHEDIIRLQYVATHIFRNTLGIDFAIHPKREEGLRFHIAYGQEAVGDELRIIPYGLLEEKEVRPIPDVQAGDWNGNRCFFRRNAGEGAIPFDLFSASFYLLTLYEEYYAETTDEHGRFDVKSATSYKHHCLEVALVDRWSLALKEILLQRFPDLVFAPRKYRFINTFDIDHPYKYQRKNLFRTAGGLARDVLTLNGRNIADRLLSNLYLKPDPYMEAIRWIEAFHAEAGKPYSLFVLRGKQGKYGRHSLSTPRYEAYLRSLRDVSIGIHPSYYAFKDLQALTEEKRELETVLSREVTQSRNHFLRFANPETFQELILAGVTDDYSVAFAKAPGFRAGTSVPYAFFDLEKNQATELMLHPTILMDTTLISHLRLSPKEGLRKIKQLIDECKRSGGDFVSLWHNSNLEGSATDNPWLHVFTESFAYAQSLEDLL